MARKCYKCRGKYHSAWDCPGKPVWCALPILVLLKILRQLSPEQLLQVRACNRFLYHITEDEILLRDVTDRITRRIHQGAREQIEAALPNVIQSVSTDLRVHFMHKLPQLIFEEKLYFWLTTAIPRYTKYDVFKMNYKVQTEDSNFFRIEEEIKNSYLSLTKKERKRLKWEAKLMALLANKRSIAQYYY